jgi:hypothetical protein
VILFPAMRTLPAGSANALEPHDDAGSE